MLVCERGPVQVSWCAVSGLLDHLLLPRGAHAPSVPGEVAGHIRVCEGWVQCDGNTLCLLTEVPQLSQLLTYSSIQSPPTAAPTCTHE